ncbi:IS481 family transposase, partial [Neisseria sp. P0009.S008]
PHRSLNGDTPFEVLQASFSTCGVNNAVIFYKKQPALCWLR